MRQGKIQEIQLVPKMLMEEGRDLQIPMDLERSPPTLLDPERAQLIPMDQGRGPGTQMEGEEGQETRMLLGEDQLIQMEVAKLPIIQTACTDYCLMEASLKEQQ